MKKPKIVMIALAAILAISLGGNVFLYSQLQAAQATVAENTAKLDTQATEIKALTELSEKQAEEIKALTELTEKQAAEIKALTELTEKQATEKPPTTEKPVTPPVEKPVTPPATSKPTPPVEKPVTPGGMGDWDAVKDAGGTPGAGAGAGTDDYTNDGSLVDPNAKNPFN